MTGAIVLALTVYFWALVGADWLDNRLDEWRERRKRRKTSK